MRFLNILVGGLPHRRLAKDGPLHPSLKRGGKENPEGTLQSPPWTSFSCSSPRHAGPPSKPRTHLESKSPISAPNFPSIPFLTGCKLLLLERDGVFSSDYCFWAWVWGVSLFFYFGFLSESKKKCAVDRIFAKKLAGIKKKQNQHWRLFAALSICESGAGVQHVPPDSSDDLAKKK